MIMSITGERGVPQATYRSAAKRAYDHHVRLLDAYQAEDTPAALAVISQHIDQSLAFTRRHIEALGGEV
jgi:DNA-binding GntR family transcriptional regulator